MRKIIICIIMVYAYAILHGQGCDTIVKYTKLFEANNDPRQDYVNSIYVYDNKELMYNINYSYNGWQIYDSIAYKYVNNKMLAFVYQATYFPLKYELIYVDTISTLLNNYSILWSLHIDAHKIMYQYVKTIDYVLSALYQTLPIVIQKDFLFSTGDILIQGIGLFFAKYGIPYNAKLVCTSFYINDIGNLVFDEYIFESYIVTRYFKYSNEGNVNEVIIRTIDKINGTAVLWEEKYILK